jgi:hypothetical protein
MIYDWAIDGRGGLRSEIMRGNQAGGVKSLTWHLEARGGKVRWQSGEDRPT